MESYNFKAIEKKWQDKWEETGAFHAETNSKKPKYYTMIEFPYPSGAGLHVGHPRIHRVCSNGYSERHLVATRWI